MLLLMPATYVLFTVVYCDFSPILSADFHSFSLLLVLAIVLHVYKSGL